jgi:hypothetical protein
MKALLALASALGIPLPENCTEDQAVEAFKAHKPAAKNVVIDFEEADVKAAFAARITDATQADKAKITALEAELASIKALLTNGPAAAAGGNAPVIGTTPAGGGKTKAEQIEDLRAQLNASKDPKERGEIIKQIRALREQK